MTWPALFVGAHPDDEILSMGVDIANHVHAGRDVHVLILTRGTASGVLADLNGDAISSWWHTRHDPASEGYAPLTRDDLGAARIAETRSALGQLGVPQANIHEGGLTDGQVTAADARSAITEVALTLGPTTSLKGQSFLAAADYAGGDVNPDHTAIGSALYQMHKASVVYGTEPWTDVRYYHFWERYGTTALSAAGIVGHFVTPYDGPGGIGARAVEHAIDAFGAWNPVVGSFACGEHSVHSDFDALLADRKALWHPDRYGA
jgi:LmbE family N-acetylglucosaminyl deacetylase